MDIRKKLSLLADAAKYDASCSSSGSKAKRDAGAGKACGKNIIIKAISISKPLPARATNCWPRRGFMPIG
jgi:predicted DNA-binding helix-hairpin-helix protein